MFGLWVTNNGATVVIEAKRSFLFFFFFFVRLVYPQKKLSSRRRLGKQPFLNASSEFSERGLCMCVFVAHVSRAFSRECLLRPLFQQDRRWLKKGALVGKVSERERVLCEERGAGERQEETGTGDVIRLVVSRVVLCRHAAPSYSSSFAVSSCSRLSTRPAGRFARVSGEAERSSARAWPGSVCRSCLFVSHSPRGKCRARFSAQL